jgi:hypothetical protein
VKPTDEQMERMERIRQACRDSRQGPLVPVPDHPPSWQYLHAWLPLDAWQSGANTLGADGWELVEMDRRAQMCRDAKNEPVHQAGYDCFFKRKAVG